MRDSATSLFPPIDLTGAGTAAVAIRVPGGSAIVCAVCGCRLGPLDARPDPDQEFRHFPGSPGRDARGCQVSCLHSPHAIVLAGPAVASLKSA